MDRDPSDVDGAPSKVRAGRFGDADQRRAAAPLQGNDAAAVQRLRRARVPRHLGVIPDGNRRWAAARGLPLSVGYAHGIAPGLRILELSREIGIAEVSVYGFTKENVRRTPEQVAAFREACVELAQYAVAAGMAVRAIGDTRTASFPASLLSLAEHRSSGDLRVNLLVNYGWQWDLRTALSAPLASRRPRYRDLVATLASGDVPAIDLVVRWGGRRRLSGFLPIQCAYSDIYLIDTLWPDAAIAEFVDAIEWFGCQDVTRGG